ncbi:MAG: 50S ribosomal protein L11 methyltransferase [Nitrospirae bacterium]|nr:50S ribosomal protein L11 methyltransferase [Nitrospirota bacterium]
MAWIALTVRTSPQDAETVGAALVEHGSVGTWEQEPGVLTAYFPGTSSPEELQGSVELLIGSLGYDGSAIVGSSLTPVEDWARAWKASFGPLQVSLRLVIVPSWVPYDPSPDQRIVILDPGMAFGTGHHATTRRCLQALDERLGLRPGARMLDVGTGSGILAIAAARLGAECVVAWDVDPEASAVAEANVARNGVDRVVAVVDEQTVRASGPYDVVVANLTAEALVEVLPLIASLLARGGECILSGILVDSTPTGPSREALVRDALRESLRVGERWEDGGWVTLLAAQKM